LESGVKILRGSKEITVFQQGIDRPVQGGHFGSGELEGILHGTGGKFFEVDGIHLISPSTDEILIANVEPFVKEIYRINIDTYSMVSDSMTVAENPW
jgi:hypothetical protein